MKKTLYTICCVVMTLVTLLVTICPAMAQEQTMQGHFGDDLIWLFTPGNSTLTVKGKGDMANRLCYEFDYYGTDAPWDVRGISNRIRRVVIGEGVTSVGSAMFECCEALEEVRLPQSLRRICPLAFACTALAEIDIPEGVTFIGRCAFQHCWNLRAVSFEGRHPMEIGSDAFADTPFLIGGNYDDNGLLICGGHLLDADNALTGVCRIPEGVTDVAGYAFSQEIELGDPHGIPGLTGVVFPRSLAYVGEFAFGGCAALENVRMSSENIRFACNPFYNTALPADTIEKFWKKSECYLEYEAKKPVVKKVRIGKTDTDYPFGSYEEIALEDYGTIRRNVLESYTVDPDNPYFKAVDGVLYSKDGSVLLRYPGGRDESVFVVPDGVRVIGEEAFARSYDDIQGGPHFVILPEGVTVIRECAFGCCGDLERICLPSTLKTIDACAFNETGLARIDLPDGLEEIGDCAFSNTKLTSIRIPESVICIRGGAFSGAYELAQVDGIGRVPFVGTFGMERELFSGTLYERTLKKDTLPQEEQAETDAEPKPEKEIEFKRVRPRMLRVCDEDCNPLPAVYLKAGPFRPYASLETQLHYMSRNYEDAAHIQWRSDNAHVFVSRDGHVTNDLRHPDAADVTVSFLDDDGKTLGESTVRVYFYRFNFQLNKLSAES